MDGTMATIMIFGGTFAPRTTAFCSGQIEPISNYQALFALLGATYGGDARSTFGLPDLRARTPVGSNQMGPPPGLQSIPAGVKTGNQTNTLTTSQMPSHTHTATFTPTGGSSGDPLTLYGLNTGATTSDPTGNMIADASTGIKSFAPKGLNTPVAMDPASITGGGGGITGGIVTVEDTGSSQHFSILNPVQGLNYVIFMTGLFPSRS